MSTPPASTPLTPALKWIGGKRQLLPALTALLPVDGYTAWCEPFIGGGAFWLQEAPPRAFINDRNAELINFYQAIRDDLSGVIAQAAQWANTKPVYYQIRNMDRTGEIQTASPTFRAARLLFLNRTCFNGLFRVNQRGEFNMAFGYYDQPTIINEPALTALSTYLNTATITFTCGDFTHALTGLPAGTFVYLDPPYDPASKTANFDRYTPDGFTTQDQTRLAQTCQQLTTQGIRWMLSNNDTPEVRARYHDCHITEVQALRRVNRDGNKRGRVGEVIITNYPPPTRTSPIEPAWQPVQLNLL